MIRFRISATYPTYLASPTYRWSPPISTVLRLLVAAYFIEAGIVLVFAPWTALWERNFFAQTQPWLATIMANGFVRGGVTGVGVVTTLAGLRDLTAAILRRPADTPETPPTP